ncbi:MAG: 23S rRNA (adenine(2503)-C(2))-methyltransferase RlmN, partial [Paracoccaceae bacterium]
MSQIHHRSPTGAAIQPDFATLPRKAAPGGRANLVGLTRERLRAVLVEAGTPERQARMREAQLWQWIYQRGAADFAAMTNLAKDYRTLLAERFEIARPEVVTRQVSADGTRKYLLR